MTNSMEKYLNPQQQRIVKSLTDPRKIQDFLDSTAYSPEYDNRCPRQVIVDRKAHCLDGALFGAAMLRRIGYPPLVVDMFPDPGMDDDHVLAIFRHRGGWGAVAKSNFVGLRYRDPVYRSLRELIMSYFEQFYNINGLKTLRAFTRPVNLSQFDRYAWEWENSGADFIEKALLRRKRYPLLTADNIDSLVPVDELIYKAGMLVANWDGIYKPVL